MAQIGILEVQVKPDLGGFQQQVTAAMAKVASGAARIGAQVTRDLTGIGASVAAGGALAVAGLATIGFKTLASIETAELQFKTLLGSAEEAKDKVQELFEFAKKTPFESGPVIEASRRLQVFGGDALNTAENLTLVGDAAASVSAPIEEVAFWVGRAYSQIKGGQPFGEAAMRLQELGVMTPEVRTEMERLAEAGASSEEVFGVLQARMAEFDGAMADLSQSMSGLVSTLKDQFTISLGEAFRPAFESSKDLLSTLSQFMETPVFDTIIEQVSALSTAFMSVLNPAIAAFEDALMGLTTSEVNAFFEGVGNKMADLVGFTGDLYSALEPIMPILAGIGAAFASTFLSGIPVIGLLIPQVSAVTGALGGLVLGFEQNRAAVADFATEIMGTFQSILPSLRGDFQTISDAISEAFRGILDAVQPAIEMIVEDLIPALVEHLADIAPVAADIVTKLAEIGSTILQAIVPAVKEMIDWLSKIEVGKLEFIAEVLDKVGIAADAASDALKGDFRGINDELKHPIGSLEGMAEILGGLAPGGLLGIASALGSTAEEADSAEQSTKALVQQITYLGDSGDTAATWIDRMGRSQPALDKVLTALAEGGVRTAELGEAIAGTDANWEGFLDDIGASGVMRDVLNGLRTEYQGAADDASELATQQEKQKAQSDAAKDSTSAYASALRDLRNALDEAAGKQADVQEAEIRMKDNLAGLAAGLRDVGAAQGLVNSQWDLNTEAGRRGAEQVQQATDLTKGYIDAIIEAGGTTEQMSQKSTEAYDSLVNGIAAGLGISAGEAAALVEQAGLIPETIESQIDVKSEEADVRMQSIQRRLEEVDDTTVVADVTTKAEMGDLDGAEAALDAYDQRKETADVLAADRATPTIRGAEGRLNSWGASSGTADVNAQDNASGVISRVREALFGSSGLDGRTATVTVQVRRPNNLPGLVPGAGGGVGLMMSTDDAGLARSATTTAADPMLAGRVLGRPLAIPDGVSDSSGRPILIENRTYLGQTEVTDVVKTESVVIERDRSMKYLTGVP